MMTPIMDNFNSMNLLTFGGWCNGNRFHLNLTKSMLVTMCPPTFRPCPCIIFIFEVGNGPHRAVPLRQIRILQDFVYNHQNSGSSTALPSYFPTESGAVASGASLL